MGKQGGKSKSLGSNSGNSPLKQSNLSENSSMKSYDKDTAVFIAMSHELKDEGNKLFQKKDFEGAMLKYEKALKLLPNNHIDVSCLRSNMAACYMQMGLSEYPRAIHECNLALEVTPKYSKALLKRARCYEALNRLDLAFKDVSAVLHMEPNNVMASEIAERVKTTMKQHGGFMDGIPADIVTNPQKARKEKSRKRKTEGKKVNDINEEDNANAEMENKKSDDGSEGSKDENKIEEEDNANVEMPNKKSDDRSEVSKDENEIEVKDNANVEMANKKSDDRSEVSKDENEIEEGSDEKMDDTKAEDKLIVDEKRITKDVEEEASKGVKLIFGEDIRWAQLPFNCSILKLREIISDRFPSLNAVLVKYKDTEGDLVTITNTEELRWAESSADHSSLRLYVFEVSPEQDPFYNQINKDYHKHGLKQDKTVENGNLEGSNGLYSRPTCISDWIIAFAHLFKNIVGLDPDAYLDLHEVGMKLYSEALEDTITSEEAQDLFSMSAEKFQEMAALALFNWGNVHMSRARKRVYFSEDASTESVLSQLKDAYDWAQKEYSEAGKRYEEALIIQPTFYEGILALSQQRFESAKLSWYYAVRTNADLGSLPFNEILQLYNDAEEFMEKGMQMWEETEIRRLDRKKIGNLLQKMNLNKIFNDITDDEATAQVENMRSQINLLWGTMLYERSMMEFKLQLPVWQECLEVAVEKFELAGASHTDIAVMLKNHCSNDTALEGLGFNINEIVQAWNEMYEAKQWQRGVPSFRLEPLIRRRVSQLHYALQHI